MIATPSTRRTIAQRTTLEGIGIHSGVPCRLTFEPAECGAGITLVDARTGATCPAHIDFANAEESERRTVVVGPEGARFEQMEHVMAALAAAGISDAVVRQENHEPPFMGGGSREFLDAILAAGTRDFGAPWEPIVIDRVCHFRDGGCWFTAAPAEGCDLSAFVEFPNTVLGSQGATTTMTTESFRDGVSRARTFALARDVEAIRKMGLGKGGSLDNTVIADETHYHNESLLYPDEPSRHKIIDLLGDLALLGRPIRGHITAWRAGHRSHVRFARFLLRELSTGS